MSYKKYITPAVEVQFAHLTQTEVIDGTDTKKYSLTVILDPELAEHEKFIQTLHELNKWGKKEMEREKPKSTEYEFANYLRDHTVKKDEQYVPSGKKTVTFRGQYIPKVFDKLKQELEPKDCPWGSKVMVEFKPTPYAMASTKKVGATLYPVNILVLETGGASADALFAAAESEINKVPTEFAPVNGETGLEGDDVPF